MTGKRGADGQQDAGQTFKDEGLVLFSHGKDSSPTATKITALRPMAEDRGWRTEALDYRGMDEPAARVELLVGRLAQSTGPVVLMGSSLGGLVSVFASQQHSVVGLFLLAPAVYWPGYEHLDYSCPAPLVDVIHGWHDDVVPVEASMRLAREHSANLHVLDDDHRLCTRLPQIEQLFDRFLGRVQAHLNEGVTP